MAIHAAAPKVRHLLGKIPAFSCIENMLCGPLILFSEQLLRNVQLKKPTPISISE